MQNRLLDRETQIFALYNVSKQTSAFTLPNSDNVFINFQTPDFLFLPPGSISSHQYK